MSDPQQARVEAAAKVLAYNQHPQAEQWWAQLPIETKWGYRTTASRMLAAADRVDPKRAQCDALCEHARGCELTGLHEVHEHDDAGMGVIHAWRRGRPCWPLHYNESDDDD